MSRRKDKLTVIYQKGKKRMVVKTFLRETSRVVVVLNTQFTNAPNTTQIASGAGRSGAAGNDAAIDSSNTLQQQSVGAGGIARNRGMAGKQSEYHGHHKGKKKNGKEAIVVINDQVVKLARRLRNASATQVAGGGGTYSTGGTNAAIESSNTKQQHAVGGGPGSRASNRGMNNRQKEKAKGKAKARKGKRGFRPQVARKRKNRRA
ncbi:hypothetical protein QIH01_11490 [Brevibacillus brevis]|uniref:Uncharacterized protein n=1 Tax=Brevibacillus brevis (strain 47 / JCM 6285 / NBRC 100599) TaxID=358681 RepID=C0Z9F8_BREBN|nr:hypothetical protein [Brevibacillus brevis]WGV61738.1 hypothetical protein QIH01_11490 [Brevibacillus brevis]BAH42628.1 hypothetical protein BBR47_16510 [Brevibacillus brevis NBRC 100599]